MAGSSAVTQLGNWRAGWSRYGAGTCGRSAKLRISRYLPWPSLQETRIAAGLESGKDIEQKASTCLYQAYDLYETCHLYTNSSPLLCISSPPFHRISHRIAAASQTALGHDGLGVQDGASIFARSALFCPCPSPLLLLLSPANAPPQAGSRLDPLPHTPLVLFQHNTSTTLDVRAAPHLLTD